MHSEMFSGRYKILENLGLGGLGEVYKALDLWTKREIALKIASPEMLAEDAEQSFKTEFLLLKELAHPGVVEVYDFGYSEDGRPYFSMEYIKGKGINEAFKQGGYDFLYRFIWELCEVLGYLHARNIVHCDLKKDNLQIVDDLFGVKLLDFGLSERIGSRIGRQLKGTLDYMAPEVFSGGNLDGRTDLYSLGVILYEIVTSQLPFPSEDPIRVVAGHLEGKVNPPRKMNPKVPPNLNRLILKLLKKSPEKRYRSVQQLKRIIGKAMKQEVSIDQSKLLYSHIYSGGVVGREKELFETLKILNRAVGLKGEMVLMEGELGIGKSAFLEELKLRAQLEGTLFLESKCLEDDLNAYRPLKEIAHNLVDTLNGNHPFFIERFGGLLDFLEPRMKNGDVVLVNSGDSFVEHREDFLNELVSFLIETSKTTPFALCIDDLHLAGSGTLKFVELLSKKIQRSRIFLCVCFKAEAVKTNNKLKILVNRLKGSSAYQQIKLGRFSLQQTKEYLTSKFFSAGLPKELISYVYRHTSGNLFFLTELTKYLVKRDIVALEDSQWKFDLKNLNKLDVPRKVEAVIWDNVRRYDRNVVGLLNLASVVGEGFDLRSVKYLSGYDEEAILLTLFVLLRDKLLRKTTDPFKEDLCYEFSSKSLQKLLYDKLDKKSKTELHHKMATFLERDFLKGEEQLVEEIAYHYNRSRNYLKAYRFSLLAAKKMRAKFANRRALLYLNDALRFSKMTKDKRKGQHRKLKVLAERGDLYRATGKPNKALKDYVLALKIARLWEDMKWIARLCKNIGAAYQEKKNSKQGMIYLREALKIYRTMRDLQEEAHTLRGIGIIYRINLEHERALDNYKRALNITNSLHDTERVAWLLNNIGIIYWEQGKYKKCLDYFKQYLLVAKKVGEDERIANALNNLGITYWSLGKYNLAEKHYLEALELVKKIGDEKSMYDRLHNLGDIAQRRGKFLEALDYNIQSLNLAKRADLPTSQPLLYIGMINLEMGRYSEGKEYLEESLEVAEQIKDKTLQVETLLKLSQIYSLLKQKKNSEQYLLRSIKMWEKMQDKELLVSLYCDAALIKLKNGYSIRGLQFLKRAKRLVNQLGIKEREAPLKIAYCEFYYVLNKKEKIDELLKEIRTLMRKREEQLYEPEYYMFLGKREWEKGRRNKSLEYLHKALEKAQEIGKLELVWKIYHLLAKFNLSLNNVEKSYLFFDRARETLVQLTNNIEDLSLRQSYLEDKEKEELLADMKLMVKTATHPAVAVA